MVSAKEKRETFKVWKEAFPSLSVYSPTTLYMTLDIAVVGIKLWAVPGRNLYRPYFMCHPLWRESNEINMGEPLILQGMYNAEHIQLDIYYKDNFDTLCKAIELTKKQIGSCVCDYVQVNDLLKIINWTSSDGPNSPLFQSRLLEYKFMIGLCINVPNLIEEVKLDINNLVKRFGRLKDWREELFNRPEKRNEILERIQSNMDEGKIAKLHRSHMVY